MTEISVWSLSGFAGALLAGVVALNGTAPAPYTDKGTKPKAVLVELFTSEGCSSCPSADALLREVNGRRTDGDQLIVGISEHVTYWNHLGWSDPYSARSYTERQNAYGERFHLDSVYTPQMVVNGAEQFVGSDQNGLRRAIHKQLDQPESVAIHIASATIGNGAVTLNFSAVGDGSVKAADLFAVIADDLDQTDVARGENSGRTLSHVAVARSIAQVAKLRADAEHTVTIPLPPSFKATQAHHLILFAQTPGSGRVLGVDTKPL